jgi:hypothetical protein
VVVRDQGFDRSHGRVRLLVQQLGDRLLQRSSGSVGLQRQRAVTALKGEVVVADGGIHRRQPTPGLQQVRIGLDQLEEGLAGVVQSAQTAQALGAVQAQRRMPRTQREAMRTHFCGLVDEALIGQTVTLCGWADVARNLGGRLLHRPARPRGHRPGGGRARPGRLFEVIAAAARSATRTACA